MNRFKDPWMHLQKQDSGICQTLLCLAEPAQSSALPIDLAWKVMKDILVQYYVITDFVSGSPREVLREAFRAGMITGDEWMEMLKVRNQLAHDYDGVIVKEHCEIIVTTYIDKFYEFGEKVEALLQKEQTE